MLPRAHRIQKHSERTRLRQSPVVFRNGLLAVRVLRRGDGGEPRAVIAVGRQVSRRAVDRNRLTRWLRESLRRELPNVSPGVDMRFSVTGPFVRASSAQCAADTHALLARAGLLR